MKKTTRSLLLVLVLLFGAFGIFTACQSNKVTISFDTNGGDAIASVSVEKDAEYTLPTPSRQGYTFDGWYLNSDFTGDKVTSVKPSEDMTVYAKWNQQYVLTLDAGSGTVSQTTFNVEPGKVLRDIIGGVTVTAPAGHQFGAWFNGSREMTLDETMPSDNLTLTAHYTVQYTIHVYEQNMDKSDYEKKDDIIGYAYAGTTPETKKEGFSLDTKHDGYVGVKALTDNASDNVFTLYYQRLDSVITLRSNYPGGENPESEVINTTFGATVHLPTDKFGIEGYALVGWNTDGSNKIEYDSFYIYEHLFNKDKVTNPPEDYVADKEKITLYAVWAKGYEDIFGGSDTIYRIDENETLIYVLRNGVFFAGTVRDREFRFEPNSDTLISGRLMDDGKFSYRDDERSDDLYNFYDSTAFSVSRTKTVLMDAFNGITYTELDEKGENPQVSKGTYYIERIPDAMTEGAYRDLYVVTFEDNGPMAGKTVNMRLGSANTSAGEMPIFSFRNDEDAALGTLPRFAGTNRMYNSYQLTLDGFGTAVYNNGSNGNVLVYYTREGDDIHIFDANLREAFVARIAQMNRQTGYYAYSEAYDGEFTCTTENGGTLTLDGMALASYTDGEGNTINGSFIVYSSLLADGMVDLIEEVEDDEAEGGIREVHHYFTIHIEIKEPEDEADDEDAPTEYIRTFEARCSNYLEMREVNNNSIFNVPLITMGEDAEDDAAIYIFEPPYNFFTGAGTYKKFATGKTQQTEDGLILITIDKFLLTREDAGNVDYRFYMDSTLRDIDWYNIEQIILLPLSTNAGNVYSIRSIKEKDKDLTSYDKVYTNENEEGDPRSKKLTLASGFAFFEREFENEDGEMQVLNLVGAYSTVEDSHFEGHIIVFTYSNVRFYFELDDENNTFYYLAELFGLAYGATNTGNIDRNSVLSFNGKGSLTYTVTTTTEGGDTQETVHTGTYTISDGDSTVFGRDYYTFTETDADGEPLTFRFLLLSTSSATVFIIYDEDVEGIYYEQNHGVATLQLDGYANAMYRDETGREYSGFYFYDKENGVIRFSSEEASFYFDMHDAGDIDQGDKDKVFTVRGFEYSTFCVWFDNWTINYEVYFVLDGYGKLSVYRQGEDPETGLIYENGKYEVSEDGEHYTFTFKLDPDDETDTVLYGTLGVVTVNGSNYLAILVQHEDRAGSYVNTEDWTVITLDSLGNASRIDSFGKLSVGRFRLITENILYYFNPNDSADACIYLLDNEKMLATPKTYSTQGYYTESLEALNFSSTGYVYIEGEQGFYTVDDNNQVTIYRNAKEGETGANRYGFIIDTSFGEFTPTKDYDGKHYFRTDGYNIVFERNSDGADKYPVVVRSRQVDEEGNEVQPEQRSPIKRLIFTPVGDGNFSVTGTAYLMVGEEEQAFGCTVVRRILGEDKGVEFYVLLPANDGYSNFRFDIEITYKGDTAGAGANNYKVTGMSFVTSLISCAYLDLYYLYYTQLGAAYARALLDPFGTMNFVTTYDENGDAGDSHITITHNKLENDEVVEVVGYFGESAGIVDYNGDSFELNEAPARSEYISGTRMYIVDLVGNDGYNYRLRMTPANVEGIRNTGYRIYSFTRVQTFDFDSSFKAVTEEREGEAAYRLEIEQFIMTELADYEAGDMYNINLYKKSEVTEENDSGWTLISKDISFMNASGQYVYVARERDVDEDGNTTSIISTTYYYIKLTLNTSSAGGIEPDEDDDDEDKFVPVEFFTKAELEKKEITAKVSEDGNFIVDLDGENVVGFVIGNYYFIATESQKTETGYKVTTEPDVNGVVHHYEITMDGDTVTDIKETKEN